MNINTKNCHKHDRYLTNLEYPAQYEKVRIPEQPCFPPRSFQGYEPLAYVRDILTLQRRVVRWLTGQECPYAITSLIDNYGFLPLNASGLVDRKYFGTQTEYNTTIINPKATIFNFYGKNVKVTQSAEDTEKVNIEIRKLKCASNLGTTDGLTDGNVYYTSATLNNITTGVLPDIISLADPNLKFGDWTDRQKINIVNYSQDRFQVETTDYINFASSGTFFVIGLISPDSTKTQIVQSEIITPEMMEPMLSGITSGICSCNCNCYICNCCNCMSGYNSNIVLAGQNQNIIFSISDWSIDDGDTYKAKIKVSFNLNNIFKDESYQSQIKPTRFKINIAHHNYDVTSFGTFLNWQRWLDVEPEINDYIKQNIFIWESPDYLYSTGEQITYQNFWYEFDNIKKFKSSNIEQIYEGNIIFHIDNIKNLYNIVGKENNIEFNTDITSSKFQYSSTYFTPSSALYQANQEINFCYTVPIKQNIYTDIISAEFKLFNGFSSIGQSTIFTLSTIINSLSSDNISNEYNEYFYDENKLNNEIFGQKYRIIDHVIQIDNNDLQVIPGKGLYYNKNEQEYIRSFTLQDKTILIFNNLNVINYLLFINNLYIQINNVWTPLQTYIEHVYFKNNQLYILIKHIDTTNILLKIIINNTIATQYNLICSDIKTTNIPIDQTQQINKLLLQVEYLKQIHDV